MWQVFGFDEQTSLIIVLAMAVAGGLLLLSLVCFIVHCCRGRSKSCDSYESIRHLSGQLTDDMIPPVFFTADLKDPLQQSDLCDGIRPTCAYDSVNCP
jgi:hypothetical protein